MALRIDHVVWGVDDLDRAAEEVQERYGLASVPGGRHPGWGTANRIVPLGDAYIELIAVVDEQEAAGSGFGRWVASAPAGRPFGWAVRTDDIAAVAARLGLRVDEGARRTAAGTLL